jgi:acyl-coenzyme A synthetase/AMP-(fatty) acid ligase
VLIRDPGVEHAVAVAWPVEAGSAHGIVAFISGSEVSGDSLLQRAREALPAYMVPSRIFQVAHMPLNANGKVDRPALMRRLVESSAENSATV